MAGAKEGDEPELLAHRWPRRFFAMPSTSYSSSASSPRSVATSHSAEPLAATIESFLSLVFVPVFRKLLKPRGIVVPVVEVVPQHTQAQPQPQPSAASP